MIQKWHNEIDDKDRITKWLIPSNKMMTQFGFISCGRWLEFMRDKTQLARPEVEIKVVEKRGMRALFD